MIIKGGQRSRHLPFSSSSYPYVRHFCRRGQAPPSPHPSSSSSDRIFLLPPPLVLRRFVSSSSSFSFLFSFFVFFVVFIPRADRGVVYMRVLETSGGFSGSSRRVLEVLNTCRGGEFGCCEGRIRTFLDDTLEFVSESIMLQKTCSAHAGSEPNNGKFRRCYYTH